MKIPLAPRPVMLNLKILLLSRKFEIYSSHRLVEEIVSREHTPVLWDPEWPLARLKIQPDIIIPRISSFQFPEAVAVLKALETTGATTLNPSQYYSVARNKWQTYQALHANQIATPETFLVSRSTKRELPLPFIVKQLESSKGDGVFLANSDEEVSEIFQKTGDRELIVQEFFSEAFGTDVRAFVIGDQIHAVMKRTARPGEFRSNLALGGTAEACELLPGESELILKTTRLLGLQVSGVDLLRTRKGSLVLEANPCPGLEGIEKYSKKNLASSIIQYAEALHGRHQTSR
ncbi:ATP-grasp domain-containing protein [Bdellovibrio sp. HCB274]|uniref:ATP-grasp domain-containing protein n=1 Tax=Bdellovibrio sp. HCB274 TaxID=3394361 RepID=UPI0039B45898